MQQQHARTTLGIAVALTAHPCGGDIQLLSVVATGSTQANGGGGATPVFLGPVVQMETDPFASLVFNNLSTGTAAAKDADGNLRGSGFGRGLANAIALTDSVAGTMRIVGEARAEFSAQPDLGMGLGRGDSLVEVVFRATQDTGFTLDAEVFPVSGGFQVTDELSLSGPGVDVRIDQNNPADVAGVTGIFQAGQTYTIRLDLRKLVSGDSSTSPQLERITAEMEISFEPGTNIVAFQCPIDFNANGVADPGDFTAWLAAYSAQDPAADLNGNGTLDPGDLTAFLAAYNAGC